jgi:polyhydroxyalkanoate synthase subunit PhaE
MTQENPFNIDMNAILSTWMKMSSDSWGDMNKMSTPFSGTERKAGGKQRSSRSQNSLDSILKTWRMVSSAMNQPDSLNANLSGIGELPSVLMKLAQNSVEGISRFQAQVQDKMNRAADHKGLFDFDNFDESFFHDWKQLYEQEIRKYLNIPQLGLTRFYQEKLAQAVDKHQLLQSALGEFMFILFKPIEESMKTLQDQLADQSEPAEWAGNAKETYQQWIGILETDYNQVLKSPEYLNVLGKLIKAMTDFSNVKDEIVQDLASSLPFPGRKEMDELYKEMYRLRKRVKELEKKNLDN